ncbi:MAG TPA: mechanosensitive ion channel domain-containing protein [Verrucomicrobiae bacterium]|nr:mechanosensitive ion channel domain-containing protein [Verrucomicrobiae bacterium]
MNSSITNNERIGNFAQNLVGLVVKLLENWFGAAMSRPLIGNLRVAHLVAALIFLAIIFIADIVIFGSLRRWTRKDRPPGEGSSAWHHIARALSKPLHFAAWIVGLYFVITPMLMGMEAKPMAQAQAALGWFLNIGILAFVVWLFFRLTRAFENRLKQWASKTDSRMDDVLAPLVGKCLRVIVPVIAIILALPALPLPAAYSDIISKLSSILIIGAISWVLFQAVNVTSQLIMTKFDISASDNLRARQVFTQVTVLKKTIYFIIGIFTIASVLMLFQQVRQLGTSILASAGVVGIIFGFAAQKTIANLFAGFQIAMTQPIRIDDVVIVENEWGRIEEITLTFVVVRIWDLRRLVLPISYFIDQPFQNWTRVSADILGTVFFYVDYTIPVEPLRAELKRILEQSKNWDKKVNVLQVTDVKDNTVELRILVSATDAGRAFDLRCEVREKMLTFIQKNFPESLPKVRAVLAEQREPKVLPHA